MDPARECLTLLPRIYDCVESARLWITLVEDVSRVLRCETMLDIFEPDRGRGKVFRCIPRSSSKSKARRASYERLDLFLKRSCAVLPGDRPVGAYGLPTESKDQHQGERKLRSLESARSYTLSGLVSADSSLLSFISCNRSKRQGSFSATEKTFVQLLLPHLHKALQLTRKLERLEQKANTSDVLPVGVISLNAREAILSVNCVAQTILDRNDGLHFSRGRIEPASPAAQNRFSQLLSAAMHSTMAGSMVIPRLSGKKPFTLQIAPCSANRSLPSANSPSVIILIFDPATAPNDLSADISEVYGLTPAESRFASLIAEGKNTKEICAKLEVTQETAKTHLKHIFLKVGVRRQSELVSVLLRLGKP
jgi:DNA-binding CsgD family transcriptional regulator